MHQPVNKTDCIDVNAPAGGVVIYDAPFLEQVAICTNKSIRAAAPPTEPSISNHYLLIARIN